MQGIWPDNQNEKNKSFGPNTTNPPLLTIDEKVFEGTAQFTAQFTLLGSTISIFGLVFEKEAVAFKINREILNSKLSCL